MPCSPAGPRVCRTPRTKSRERLSPQPEAGARLGLTKHWIKTLNQMTKTNLPLNADRLCADVMRLADITDPARPYTRRSFTALFLDVRTFITTAFADAGLVTRIDTAGNLIGRIDRNDPKLEVTAIRSPSDTV